MTTDHCKLGKTAICLRGTWKWLVLATNTCCGIVEQFITRHWKCDWQLYVIDSVQRSVWNCVVHSIFHTRLLTRLAKMQGRVQMWIDGSDKQWLKTKELELNNCLCTYNILVKMLQMKQYLFLHGALFQLWPYFWTNWRMCSGTLVDTPLRDLC